MSNQYKIEYLPISKVKLNPSNPRLIKNDAFKKLVKSLEDCPSLFDARPLLCSDRTGELIILGGNMRYQAAMELKYKKVPVIIMPGLTEAQEREVAIKDNGAFGEWDFDLLANEWADLPLDDWGIDLPDDWLQEEGELVDAEPQIDRAEELNKTWRVKRGDVWSIGDHRLMCGDSTSKADVGALMGQEKAMLMVTDPPYGVEYDAEWRLKAGVNKRSQICATGKVQNDDRTDWRETWALFSGDIAYIWHAGVGSPIVAQSLEAAGFVLRALICWGKPSLVISRGHYHHQHEPCWYAVRRGATASWIGDRKQSTLWDIPNMHRTQGCVDDGHTSHSTQKPLECMARPIRNHNSEIVYDPFLGSGTTMVACQNLNRKCRGLEIDPNYCAVILQRMKDAFPDLEIRRAE